MSENAEATQAPSIRFGFVKFVVKDLAAMTAFYETVLGLVCTRTIELPAITEKVMNRPNDPGGFGLVLYHNKDGREVTVGDGHGPVGLYVRDVDAAFAHAVAHGAAPHRPPFEIGAMRIAFVLDPEGRELEFLSIKT